MAVDDSDDEEITLSSHALDALKSFYTERDARTEQFEQLKAQAERRAAGSAKHVEDGGEEKDAGGPGGIGTTEPLSMSVFAEDWNESQFWYADETATLLARQLLEGATDQSVIVVVSAPSVFIALKNLQRTTQREASVRPKLVLLEHDQRFSVFPEFVFYDFAQPVRLPAELKGTADRIICDPPFLSEDCQTKAALTVRWLSKQPGGVKVGSESAEASAPKVIVCTGERMESLVLRLYKSIGLRTTEYDPIHTKGLSNEFYCYANFDSPAWKWRPAIEDR